MDESQFSPRHHHSMFGMVHLQITGAITGSHMLMHLNGRGGKKQSLRCSHYCIYRCCIYEHYHQTANGVSAASLVSNLKLQKHIFSHLWCCLDLQTGIIYQVFEISAHVISVSSPIQHRNVVICVAYSNKNLHYSIFRVFYSD